jgi:acyl carrier protein phosphodiesterase
MNFLAHLFISGAEPELLVGNLLGDFVKGRLDGKFPAGIERGIFLHRRIDSFAGRNPHFLRSKRRLDASFGHYRGVLVDLFYDHFLAVQWDDYADIPFFPYLADTFRVIREYEEFLPERLRRIAPLIFAELLPSYLEVQGIERALQRMSARIARPNPLGEGGAELRRHYNGLSDDFREFLPELQEFVRDRLVSARGG